MKKLITIIAIFACLSGFAQKTINAPKTVYDTTRAGQSFTFKWTGEMRLVTVDSSTYDTINGFKWKRNYLSLNNSYAEFQVTKIRGIVSGDTLQRQEVIRIPFIDIFGVVDPIYSSTTLKKAYKKDMRKIINKKISEE